MEQVINFADDIFQKNENEEILQSRIKDKLIIDYNVFYSEISYSSAIKPDTIVSNFFSRISVYISNHSLGCYSELIVNKFLRYLDIY